MKPDDLLRRLALHIHWHFSTANRTHCSLGHDRFLIDLLCSLVEDIWLAIDEIRLLVLRSAWAFEVRHHFQAFLLLVVEPAIEDYARQLLHHDHVLAEDGISHGCTQLVIVLAVLFKLILGHD